MEDGSKAPIPEIDLADADDDIAFAEEQPLKDQITGLVDDARQLAHAEIEYYRTKLSVNMAATKSVLTLFGIGITMAATAIIALILGLLLIVSSYYGPIAATGLVTGGFLLLASILLGMAIKRVKKLPLDENEK